MFVELRPVVPGGLFVIGGWNSAYGGGDDGWKLVCVRRLLQGYKHEMYVCLLFNHKNFRSNTMTRWYCCFVESIVYFELCLVVRKLRGVSISMWQNIEKKINKSYTEILERKILISVVRIKSEKY